MEPELIIGEDGTQRWKLDNKLHRVGGPAVIRPDGTELWFFGGKLHRVDGPAIIDPDGQVQYWAFNTRYNSLEELQIGVVLNQ